MKGRRFVILGLLILVCFVSCKKPTITRTGAYDIELPDMVMHQATYLFGEMDKKPLVMNAETITVYSGRNGRTLLEKTSFIQEDEGLEGSCDNASVNSSNTIATLEGNVKLKKKTDDFEIECDILIWNDEEQTITSDSEVMVKYGDGTELQAIGFLAKLDDNIYEFGKIIEGRFTDED